MKLTLAQQADFVELSFQSYRDRVHRVLTPLVEKGKRSKEELSLAIRNRDGLEAAFTTLRYLAQHETKLRKLLDKQPHPDLLAAG